MRRRIFWGSLIIAALIMTVPATGLANNLLINSDFTQPLPNTWEAANNLSVVDLAQSSFNQCGYDYTAGVEGLYLTGFPNVRNMDESTSRMDKSQLDSIPEPATLLLTSLGLGMLGLRRLRRKK